MRLISHRGNVDGKYPQYENLPEYVDKALDLGYDVEVDVWYISESLFLGHDKAEYTITLDWLLDRSENLWIHCKNHEALEYLSETNLHYFWHDSDDVTITSKGIIWSHPKIKPIKKSVAVLPELNDWDLNYCLGVCSDSIMDYK